ncbi:MAG: hypothetical protein V3U43_08675 [Pseudomonadales bacterium]
MTQLHRYWIEELEARGARSGQRHGVACVLADGPRGIVDLSNQGVIAFRGPDAREFLQGYLTCDTDDIAADRPVPGALCNLQGRVITNFVAVQRDAAICLRMHRSVIEPTFDALRKYIVFSKTKMEDASDRWVRIGIHEPEAEQALGEALTTPDAGFAFELPDASNRHELWIEPDGRALVDRLLERFGLMSPSQWDRLAIDAMSPEITQATSARFLPQMLRLDELGAVSFEKGCYLGQEIVARVQYRGEHKRELTALQADALEKEPSLGTKVCANGKPAGEVVMVAKTNEKDPIALLAVLPRGTDPENDTLTLEGIADSSLQNLLKTT